MLELRSVVQGKEYSNNDEKHNYIAIDRGGTMHAFDGEESATQSSATGFYIVTDEIAVDVNLGYPQYEGDSIVIQGVEGDELIVKDRFNGRIKYTSNPYLKLLAAAYSQLIQTF